jgi:phosphoserine phosphatase RsbU/P
MKRTALFALLLILSACGSLAAQSFSLVTGREPVASLDGMWRFHTGDDPAWASPSFDDSQWPLIRSGESWTKQGYPAFNGYAWYRFKVEIPGNGRPVDLLLTGILDGYTVYADGKLIGSAGSAVATRDPVFAGRPAIFPLPAGARGPQSIQIALRVWTYLPIVYWAGAGARGKGNEAGDPALLAVHRDSYLNRTARNFVSEYAYGLFAGLIGLAILALFLLRPGDREYLWFSILLLSQSADAALHLMLNLGSLPMPLWDLLRLIAGASSVLAALAFFSVVLRVRRSFLWWTICLVVAASPLAAALIYFQWSGMGISFAIAEACIVPAFVWIIARLLIGAFRKDVSARLLLMPVALSYGMQCASLTARISGQLRGSSDFSVDITLFERPFPISLGDVIGLIFLLSLLIFLVRRFSLARKEEERLAAEFEAAKTVQSLLIPSKTQATPGFTVESVYLPAQEVGGDFFHIQHGDDGSLLIVVGDVSGKGLKAAMTVSAIIGALRGSELREPADVLAYLNRVLLGQISGFVTCSAARIAADGAVTIANAGHLSPYRNGEELAVDSGLPLGIGNEAAYAEVTHRLSPNDRLTFVSDGVVEARDKSGALFGFERTAGLSTQPADAIAQAAQAFGQDDDITVLSVMRAAYMEAASA